MESSLASLFMEGNLPCLPLSWATSGESVEELQQQLTSTSLELQSAREAARLQSRINEAKVHRLQVLLDAARKERDEARAKCSKLRECLLYTSRSPHVPMPAVESPSSCLPSSISSTSSPTAFSHPASPIVETMGLQDLKQTVSANEVMSNIFECDVVNKLSLHQASDVQEFLALEQNADPSSITMGDSQQQFSMDILNADVSLDGDESLDLVNLQVEHSPSSAWEPSLSGKSNWNAHTADDTCMGNTLLRHSSSVSSNEFQSMCGVVEPLKVSSSLYEKPATMGGHVFPMQSVFSPSPKTASHPRITPEVSRFAQPHSSAMQPKAAHVEPFERDANIMHEDALPEKGKLLQAVIQAGPLLQNLLLAGPLPQWRYPPPEISTIDIPKVPMVPSSGPLNYSSSSASALPIHHNPFVNYSVSSTHPSVPQFAGEKGVTGSLSALPRMFTSTKSERSTCYGGRKLRRVSPIGVK